MKEIKINDELDSSILTFLKKCEFNEELTKKVINWSKDPDFLILFKNDRRRLAWEITKIADYCLRKKDLMTFFFVGECLRKVKIQDFKILQKKTFYQETQEIKASEREFYLKKLRKEEEELKNLRREK